MSIFYSKNRQFINNKLQPVTAEETGRRMRILYGVRKVIRLLAPFHSNIQLLIPMGLICSEKTVPVIKKMLIKQNPLCVCIKLSVLLGKGRIIRSIILNENPG